jgi:hypothetical protein
MSTLAKTSRRTYPNIDMRASPVKPARAAAHECITTRDGRELVLRQILVDQAGFRSFRRATETPFNLVLEARP